MSGRTHPTLAFLAWTLLATEAGPQTPAPAASSGTGSVSGRIMSTNAGDIADAVLTLTHVGGSTPSPIVLTTRSDLQGGFTFDRLMAGRYRLAASKRGYTNRQPLRAPASQFDTDVEVTVTDGQQRSGVELPLYREAIIAGRIAEPDGIPAPDVQVFAAVRQGTGHVLLPETRTTAEWDGRYRIAGLPPGEYLIVVLPAASADPARARINAERRAPESSSATRHVFDATLYPGVTRGDAAETITVFEGISVSGIDVWLTPAERFSISGRVSWPEGAKVDNIVIEYANLTAQRSGLWTVPEPGDVFSINGVPRGTVVLLVRADSDRGPLAGVVSTEVSLGPVEDVELTLAAPGVVEGRIVYEADVPAANRATRIALTQRLLPVSPLYPTPESVVSSDGRFRIEHALGEYEFTLMGPPPGLRVTRVLQHGRQITGGRIHIGSGETITGLEIVVSK